MKSQQSQESTAAEYQKSVKPSQGALVTPAVAGFVSDSRPGQPTQRASHTQCGTGGPRHFLPTQRKTQRQERSLGPPGFLRPLAGGGGTSHKGQGRQQVQQDAITAQAKVRPRQQQQQGSGDATSGPVRRDGTWLGVTRTEGAAGAPLNGHTAGTAAWPKLPISAA
uniref:Uncharacterized protein n=1 Tax=Sphaerodactylus townsendi TaxID=933632 RepID=A0ACB8FWJ5_9SAUR